ncbi:sensor histidine kinase [Nesterenkonia alba]|uniref:sensor histidine kinase n=1 Tax=Nesterenkonia alba TaxID=515814 RepID=UPI0003B390A1|nr:histidine kinase [Nesterenkonia alba]
MSTHDDATAPARWSAPEGFEQLGLVRRRGVRGWFRRHPKWMNGVVVAIYGMVALWGFPLAMADMGQDAFWLIPGYLIIMGLLCFRHAAPVSVLLPIALAEAVLLILYPWQPAQMLGVCFIAYCVGLHRGLVWGLGTSVPACLVGYSTYFWIEQWQHRYGDSRWVQAGLPAADLPVVAVTLVVIMVFATAACAAIGAAVRRGREHEREILDWARRSHELAQVGERNRIAREMHDVVAHSLSVMISLADGARVVVRRDPERAGEVLDELSSTGRTALADMRRVIGVLKKGEDVVEARKPVQESLEELFEGFRQAGLPLKITTSGPALPEDAAFGLTVHRIIQESLTNVLRYGQSVTDVEVSIEHHPATSQQEWERLQQQGYSEKEAEALGLAGPARVIISVADDGVVIPGETQRKSVGSGLGIKGMQERASFYNGSVWAGPGKYRGWTVRAVLEPPEEKTSTARAAGTDPEGSGQAGQQRGQE